MAGTHKYETHHCINQSINNNNKENEQVTSIEVDSDVQNDYDDDEAMRAQAAVNSPKGDNGMTFYDDVNNENNAMSLNLGDDINDDEDDYDPNNVTPNTKFRNQADVNSPRAKTKQKWGADDTESSAGIYSKCFSMRFCVQYTQTRIAVAGLMTQVTREEAAQQKRGGANDMITSVSRVTNI